MGHEFPKLSRDVINEWMVQIINIHMLFIDKMGTPWEHSNRVFREGEQGFESLPLRTLITRFLFKKLSLFIHLIFLYFKATNYFKKIILNLKSLIFIAYSTK